MSAASQHPTANLPPALNTPRITPQDFDPPAAGIETAAGPEPIGSEPEVEPNTATAADADGPRPKAKRRRLNHPREWSARVASMEKLLPRKVPILRDIRIYESVVFEKISQYDVAEIFGISQPRVCQIVQEVRTWKSTVPWEFAGMTDEQQINLATHETRRWLEVIRDKCLAKADDTECGSSQMVFDKNGTQVRNAVDRRSQTPKPGFMAVALQAVIKAGQLGGAGEQWRQRRVQSEECGVEETPCGGEFKVPSSRFKVDGEEQPEAHPQLGTLNVEPLTRNPSPSRESLAPAPTPQSASCNPQSDGLLKEKSPGFSPVNGKANGHATSALRKAAQVQALRRRKNRQIAYQAAADRQRVGPDSRRYFFQMLKQLDGVAQRVERLVDRELRMNAKKGIQRTGDELAHMIQSARRHHLERQLRLNRHVRTHPYGMPWVWEQYDLSRGKFRWDVEEK